MCGHPRTNSVFLFFLFSRRRKYSPFPGSMQLDTAGRWTRTLVCSNDGPSTQVSKREYTPKLCKWSRKIFLGEKCMKLNKMHSTGKYIEGQTCDPKTWKANFRCAMNSLPDIEEMKDKSINKGHQAVRVFRMLPATPKSRGETTDRKWASICRLMDRFSFYSLSEFILQLHCELLNMSSDAMFFLHLHR